SPTCLGGIQPSRWKPHYSTPHTSLPNRARISSRIVNRDGLIILVRKARERVFHPKYSQPQAPWVRFILRKEAIAVRQSPGSSGVGDGRIHTEVIDVC